jgi:hypothetical protein
MARRRKRKIRITVIDDVPEEQLAEIVLRLIEPARIQAKNEQETLQALPAPK